MKKQVTHLSVFQTSKVVALFYALFSLLHAIIGIFMVVFGSGELKIIGTVCLAAPIIMFIGVFPVMLLCCWLYNVAAKWGGGIEFTVEDK